MKNVDITEDDFLDFYQFFITIDYFVNKIISRETDMC